MAGGAGGASQGERLAAVEARLEGFARLAQQVQQSAALHGALAERVVKVEAAHQGHVAAAAAATAAVALNPNPNPTPTPNPNPNPNPQP